MLLEDYLRGQNTSKCPKIYPCHLPGTKVVGLDLKKAVPLSPIGSGGEWRAASCSADRINTYFQLCFVYFIPHNRCINLTLTEEPLCCY